MQSKEIVDFLKKANRTNDMVCILPGSSMSKDIIKYLKELERYRTARLTGKTALQDRRCHIPHDSGNLSADHKGYHYADNHL
mgnify:CR=1 FL=1